MSSVPSLTWLSHYIPSLTLSQHEYQSIRATLHSTSRFNVLRAGNILYTRGQGELDVQRGNFYNILFLMFYSCYKKDVFMLY